MAILKKNDLHESIRQPVINRDKSHDRPERPDVKRDTCHELRAGPVGRRSSNARQLGCVFHDMKPPKSSSILRKSSDIRKPIQRVKVTKAVARHADIRDQNPSLGCICPGEPHERSPNAPKFEDRCVSNRSCNSVMPTFTSLQLSRYLSISLARFSKANFRLRLSSIKTQWSSSSPADDELW